MKRLLRHFEDGAESVIEIDDRMVLIGSSADNDIVIQDASIGDVALKIGPEGDGHVLEVMQKGKARLNGLKIKKALLSAGDRIDINSHVFVYDYPPAAAPENKGRMGQFFSTFNAFAAMVGKERDLQKLLTRLMRTCLDLFNGSDAFIFKFDREGNPQVFVSTGSGSSGERFSDTVVQTVVKSKKGIVIENALSDPYFSKAKSVADLGLVSIICAPIMITEELIGIIYLGSRKHIVSYSQHDLTVLSVYAAITGLLINHVDYIGQQNKAIIKLTGCSEAGGFIAESKIMQDVLASVNALACSDITVMLEGPTGSGKSHIAEIIHARSGRPSGPLLIVNCSSLRGELMESELFGHRKGSFTGAFEDHAGLFRSAGGGTLVLDEIGELNLSVQAKLLRVLESGKIRPIGQAREEAANVRVICATNKNLAEMVKSGSFRGDLFYRIDQFSIKVPPLREREEDIVLLAYFFLEKFKSQYPAKDFIDFHPQALRFIQHYEWPGNVRELSNTIHRAMLSCDGPLLSIAHNVAFEDCPMDFEKATRDFQKDFIEKAIKRYGGSKEETAKMLGLSRSTFFRYQALLGI